MVAIIAGLCLDGRTPLGLWEDVLAALYPSPLLGGNKEQLHLPTSAKVARVYECSRHRESLGHFAALLQAL